MIVRTDPYCRIAPIDERPIRQQKESSPTAVRRVEINSAPVPISKSITRSASSKRVMQSPVRRGKRLCPDAEASWNTRPEPPE